MPEQPNIPFFNYPHVFKQYEDEVLDCISDVGRRGAFILQRDLEEFERNLAEFSGEKFALGVANGTDALIIALRAAGIGEGDEVIFSSHTYVATAAAIHFVGGIPVPVECGADHMIDPDAVRAAITPRTCAIMPTQLNGRTCDMQAIQEIADENGLLVFEDAAQALGSKFQGRCAGTFGIAGTISFYPAKTLGSLGDGGAIFTNDESLFDWMYAYRDHGRNQDGDVIGWGLNSRLDNLQAAILNVKLKHYADDLQRRRELAGIYQDQLGSVDELHLPPAPDADAEHFDVFQNYEIESDNRDNLQTFLKAGGVGTIVQWGGKVVHQLGLGVEGSLPFTERMISRSLLLPMHTALTDDEVGFVCKRIKAFHAQSANQRAA
ncbi:MAG: DegT/DnrJ/EryC1/StrS family aminotransferase [Planctomycetota bacterium]|nr:DegT/DnrJ/EryC1/StrS family aminotransferase [Planctomycetota bacterium]